MQVHLGTAATDEKNSKFVLSNFPLRHSICTCCCSGGACFLLPKLCKSNFMRVGEVSNLGKVKRSTPKKLLDCPLSVPFKWQAKLRVEGWVGVAGNLRIPRPLLFGLRMADEEAEVGNLPGNLTGLGVRAGDLRFVVTKIIIMNYRN